MRLFEDEPVFKCESDEFEINGWMALAREGRLSGSFDRWLESDAAGWTVAHEAALHGRVPSRLLRGFYGVADCHGVTVRDARLIGVRRRLAESRERREAAGTADETREIREMECYWRAKRLGKREAERCRRAKRRGAGGQGPER
jgi:hypothetical protein